MNQVAEEVCETVAPRSSRIGLVAYCALPPFMVFVRVPNEPGRWLMTHRCVVEVACAYCKAVEGEPCFNAYRGRPPVRYWTGTHTDRRKAYSSLARSKPLPQHKPHLSLLDVRAARQTEA